MTMQGHSHVADIVWQLICEHGDGAAIVAYAPFAYSASARHEGSVEQWHRVLDELIDLDFVPSDAGGQLWGKRLGSVAKPNLITRQ
jgi:hypothetical protein